MGTVGELIERHQSEILRMWTEGAGGEALARGLSPEELANLMPEYLALLGHGGPEVVRLSDAQRQVIERHVANRLRQGFVLNEILTEIALLGRCASRFIAAQTVLDRPSVADIAGLFTELTLTSVAVTNLFNEHLLEDEQTEKRCARMVQKIADDAIELRSGSLRWRARLTEILQLVMNAIGARTAALLLFDAKSDELIMSASAGDAVEQLEQHVSSIDPSTFAGKIASGEGQATEVVDAETTELGVSDTLRRSGIHSLLGVRLSARHLLRGVIYVGIRERRPFSASEIRRIEGLGATLSVHLDNAQLNATLREKVAELEAEVRLRERFVSVLMHDLQAPLAAARAHARELAARGEPLGAAAKIGHELERADRMVSGLLDVQRIRTGQQLPLVIEECDLTDIARDVVEDLRSAHADRVVLHADRGLRGMWSPELLRRAIRDLTENGLEHGAHDRQVVVSVRRGGGGAEIAVHNAGPGIRADAQAQLFRPFSHHGAPIQNPPHGWGLGLTLVWGCAEAHGGRVSVECLPGKGTTFTLIIPYDARPYAE